ncbi:MAG: zf-HC2 domain-containing protein [Desulfobacterota bacterium]|nr:zf-HC2 domain-containing protein [Thermodesulfobacteriota bacterium]
MNKSCKKCRADLVAYYDRELSAKRMREIADHIAACPTCADEFSVLQETLSAVPAFPEIQPSADYDRTFWEKIRAVRATREQHRWWGVRAVLSLIRFQRPVFIAAAGVCVCLCFAALFAVRHQRQLDPEERAVAQQLDLFAHYDIIRQSDALEHFELIRVLDAFVEDDTK